MANTTSKMSNGVNGGVKISARRRERRTDDGTHEDEEVSRNSLSEFSESLKGERKRVQIGNVVRYNRHGEDNCEEGTEGTRSIQYRIH